MDYPQWWVMVPCRHWDAAKNKRYRFIRLDGPLDRQYGYPAMILDGVKNEMVSPAGQVDGSILLRRATPGELQTTIPEVG